MRLNTIEIKITTYSKYVKTKKCMVTYYILGMREDKERDKR